MSATIEKWEISVTETGYFYTDDYMNFRYRDRGGEKEISLCTHFRNIKQAFDRELGRAFRGFFKGEPIWCLCGLNHTDSENFVGIVIAELAWKVLNLWEMEHPEVVFSQEFRNKTKDAFRNSYASVLLDSLNKYAEALK